MSFWNTSENKTVEAESDYEASAGFDPMPDGTKVAAAITEIAWDEYDGDEFINATWTVLQGEYKNRKFFQKIKVRDGNPKVRDKALRMLAALDANTGGRLMQVETEPTDMDLASNLAGKPIGVRLGLWEIKNEETDEVEKRGNWVTAIAPLNKKKNPAAKKPVEKKPVQQIPEVDDFDDDVPF